MGEEPSCSNVGAVPEEMETDIAPGSVTRYRFPCPNCLEMSYGLELVTSDIFNFGKNLRSVIAESEALIKDFLKRQRSERKASSAGKNKMFNVDEESSLSGSEEDLLLATEEVSENNFMKQRTYGRNRNSEKRTYGSWLIISFVTGGWNYSTVKNYFLNEYGVKCSRSRTTPERLAMTGVYKAIVKFENREELKHVVNSLKESQLHDKFLFLSFDKRPVNQEFSESDSDDGRTGYLVPISKETKID